MSENSANEKKCPACGSAKVEFEGLVHGSSAGCAPAENQRKFKCSGCNEIFWIEANPKNRSGKS
jgi:rubredoxin